MEVQAEEQEEARSRAAAAGAAGTAAAAALVRAGTLAALLPRGPWDSPRWVRARRRLRGARVEGNEREHRKREKESWRFLLKERERERSEKRKQTKGLSVRERIKTLFLLLRFVLVNSELF